MDFIDKLSADEMTIKSKKDLETPEKILLPNYL